MRWRTAQYFFEMFLIQITTWMLIVKTESYFWIIPEMFLSAYRTWAFLERTK